MQNFLFRKVELWFVALLILLAFLGFVFFASLVKSGAKQNVPDNKLTEAALAVASIPDTIRQLMTDTEPLAVTGKDRFDGRKGWTLRQGAAADPGYLLLARTDGDGPRATVELVSLQDYTTRHVWRLDPAKLFSDLGPDASLSDQGGLTQRRFRTMHPLLTKDGALVFHGQVSPIVSVDACGGKEWRTDKLAYHHSLNVDADGNYWSPAKVRSEGDISNADKTHDALAKISPGGALLWSKTIPDLLVENGMTHLIYHAYERTPDPVHLNDIQPALADGPYWKKGDLFVSLRTPSLILLYRPSTGKIIWQKAGPWIEQHDVDILDDHRISVFDNNVQDRGKGGFIDGSSQVRIYDFSTDTVSTPLEQAALDARILAVNNGLADHTASGLTIVEEDTAGRILIFGAEGTLDAEYVNRAENGKLYRMGWSRYVDADTANAALSKLAATSCPAGE
jgi:hypothetical protein